MANYGGLRDGLKTRLETVSAFKVVYDTLPDTVVSPCAVVSPGSPVVEYHESMAGSAGGLQEFRFEIIALAGRFDSASSQNVLDALISGTGSVITAVEGDKTLGGAAVDTTVDSARDYGTVMVDGVPYWGVRFLVTILAR